MNLSTSDLTGAKWRKARASSTPNGSCVEVAALGAAFAIRDSKDRNGPVLGGFAAEDWTAFLARVRETY
jgi:Domain of unknown function (DUF397)